MFQPKGAYPLKRERMRELELEREKMFCLISYVCAYPLKRERELERERELVLFRQYGTGNRGGETERS